MLESDTLLEFRVNRAVADFDRVGHD